MVSAESGLRAALFGLLLAYEAYRVAEEWADVPKLPESLQRIRDRLDEAVKGAREVVFWKPDGLASESVHRSQDERRSGPRKE